MGSTEKKDKSSIHSQDMLDTSRDSGFDDSYDLALQYQKNLDFWATYLYKAALQKTLLVPFGQLCFQDTTC